MAKIKKFSKEMNRIKLYSSTPEYLSFKKKINKANSLIKLLVNFISDFVS